MNYIIDNNNINEMNNSLSIIEIANSKIEARIKKQLLLIIMIMLKQRKMNKINIQMKNQELIMMKKIQTKIIILKNLYSKDQKVKINKK